MLALRFNFVFLQYAVLVLRSHPPERASVLQVALPLSLAARLERVASLPLMRKGVGYMAANSVASHHIEYCEKYLSH